MRARGLAFVVSLVLIVAAVMVVAPLRETSGQEDSAALEARVAGLEARVSALESEVAELRGTSPSETETYTIKGDLRLRQQNTGFGDTVCQGHNDSYTGRNYEAIQIANEVLVKDQAGNVLGRGELGQGQQVPGDIDWFRHCLMPFEISGLPMADTYSVVIEGINGEIPYTFDELQAANWTIHITLGNDKSWPTG